MVTATITENGKRSTSSIDQRLCQPRPTCLVDLVPAPSQHAADGCKSSITSASADSHDRPNELCQGAHGAVVSHPHLHQEALGSNHRGSTFAKRVPYWAELFPVLPDTVVPSLIDSLQIYGVRLCDNTFGDPLQHGNLWLTSTTFGIALRSGKTMMVSIPRL